MSRYLNSIEASIILGVKPDTLRFWRYTGKFKDELPHSVHVSRRVFYREEDVMRFSQTMYCPA
ncbi:MerR family transcriptional regulator [Pseudomonas rustica]